MEHEAAREEVPAAVIRLPHPGWTPARSGAQAVDATSSGASCPTTGVPRWPAGPRHAAAAVGRRQRSEPARFRAGAAGTALTRGIQAFKIAFAKRLNKQIGHRGAVFEDRYHDEVLVTPTQVRRCIGYVLCNWRKHGFATGATTVLDPYSTARHFTGWAEQPRLEAVSRGEADILPNTPPKTWLLRVGWQRGGPPPSVFEVPSRSLK